MSLVRLQVFALFGLSTCFCCAQDVWPEFRGPDGDGVANSSVLPDEFSETQNVKWKTAIGGKGWSSPVVLENQVWLTTATEDGKQMSAVCVDLQTGKVLHNKVVFENEAPDFCHEMNSYATPTPVIESGRVYVHFGKYGTACLDTQTGEKLWEQRELKCDHFRGPGSSPILFEDSLIVAFDGFDQQYVAAINKVDGSLKWKTNREIDYVSDNGDWKKAFATGVVIPVDGKSLLIYPSAGATEAFDPRTGERVWIAQHGGMNASSRPVITQDGLVVVTNGMGQLVGIRPDGTGDISDTHVDWKMSQGVSKKASQLIVSGLFYMISDRGVLTCMVPGANEVIYRQRLQGSFAASPIYAGGKIYWPSIEGKVYIVEAGADFRLVATCEIGDGFMASPAVVGNRLILRSKSHLYCIEASE